MNIYFVVDMFWIEFGDVLYFQPVFVWVLRFWGYGIKNRLPKDDNKAYKVYRRE